MDLFKENEKDGNDARAKAMRQLEEIAPCIV
jgi:hypothetical protein